MTFTSLIFLLFLPVVFAAHWAFRSRILQNSVLLAASLAFYGWWDVRFLGLMVGAAVLDYGAGLALERVNSPRGRKALLVASLVVNFGLLGFFKYFDFFIESFAQVAQSVGWSVHPATLRLILPVGISFYTFQTLSYTIDVYRRTIRATPNPLDYLVYVTFFPQLVAGPIERADRLLPQFEVPRRFDPTRASDGCRQILWGFFKKIMIADTLALVVDPVFATPSAYGGGALAAAVVFFAFQIYTDFSAYSDIAIGLGRLFGIELMRNFAYPYFSRNILEFWRRWHVSLSTWFRDYLYVPLGGNRVGKSRLALNVLLTFTVSGLWHGAAWTFVLWGLLHGLAVLPFALSGARRSPEDTPGGESNLPRPGDLARMAATFGAVCLAWVFFRAASVKDAILILGRILSAPFGTGPSTPLPEPLPTATLAALLVGFVLAEWVSRRRLHPLVVDRWPAALRWTAYTALVWMTILLGSRESVPFYYFQF